MRFFIFTHKNKTQIIQEDNMEYKIKDINLAIEGRNELELAETEMPGLMALRKE